MAKSKKKAAPGRPKQYEDKLAVNGSFLDIMKVAGKNANEKSVAPKKTKPSK